MKRVCEAVTARSACLAGAGLAAIIRRIPKELVTVAIDGSFVRFHPTYKRRLEESIDTVLKVGGRNESLHLTLNTHEKQSFSILFDQLNSALTDFRGPTDLVSKCQYLK